MKSSVTISMDEDLVKEADEFFGELGMSLSTAVTVFVRQSLRERRIPFSVSAGPAPAQGVANRDEAVRAAVAFSRRYPGDFERLAQ